MSVPRLVVHVNPEGVETPLLLLAQLREIDPRVELVYFGARDWRLGSVRIAESAGRDQRAARADIMVRELDRVKSLGIPANPKNYMLADLLRQGFAQIAKYIAIAGDIAGTVLDEMENEHTTVIENFRRRNFHALHDPEQTFAQMMDNANGVPEKAASRAVFEDILHNDVRAHYRREVRGHTTFGHGGQTGGRGKLITNPGSFTPAGPLVTRPEEVMAEIESLMAELGGSP